MSQNFMSLREMANKMGLDRRTAREYAQHLGYTFMYVKRADHSDQKAACLTTVEAKEVIYDYSISMKRRETADNMRRLQKDLKAMTHERDRLMSELEAIQRAPKDTPEWMKAPQSNKEHHATLVLVLSDMHFGEVVSKREVYGANEYNVKIASRRVKAIGDHAIMVARDYFCANSKLVIDGAVIMLAGDAVSGTIHDELSATNEQTTMESIVSFVPIVCEEIVGKLLTEFKQVRVLSVPGNHDRFGRKVSAKHTATSAATWVFGKWIESKFSGVEGISFDISEAADTYHQIYSTKFCLTHGDSFKSGDSMIGMLGPVKRGTLRKSFRDSHIGNNFDILVCGHFHSYCSAPSQGFITNGSLKGFDEYSARCGYSPEPPMQAMFLVAPEYKGVTFSAPVFAERHK